MSNCNLKKLWFVAITLILTISFFSGCANKNEDKDNNSFKRSTASDTSNSRLGSSESQTSETDNKVLDKDNTQKRDEKSFSLSEEEKSAKLPKGYPSDILPIYEGSFIDAVFELEGSYTLTAYNKDDVKKVMSFYEKILKEAKSDMETKTEESITSMGSIKGYSYTIDVGKTDERGYKTVISISLQPKK